jgi:FAM32A
MSFVGGSLKLKGDRDGVTKKRKSKKAKDKLVTVGTAEGAEASAQETGNPSPGKCGTAPAHGMALLWSVCSIAISIS